MYYIQTKAELEAEPDADDLMSPGLLTGSSSNVSLDTDLDPFLKNQCNFNDNDAVISTPIDELTLSEISLFFFSCSNQVPKSYFKTTWWSFTSSIGDSSGGG